MSLKIAVQMDPIQRINIKGDSTFALLLEAQKRGHTLAHYTPDRLAMLNGRVFANVESLAVRDRAGEQDELDEQASHDQPPPVDPELGQAGQAAAHERAHGQANDQGIQDEDGDLRGWGHRCTPARAGWTTAG